MKNTNSNVKNQGRKQQGAKVRVCALLAPYTRALGRSVQVGHKLSHEHEQNRLVHTKVRPALGKTSLMIELVLPIIKYGMASPEVGSEFALNQEVEYGDLWYFSYANLNFNLEKIVDVF